MSSIILNISIKINSAHLKFASQRSFSSWIWRSCFCCCRFLSFSCLFSSLFLNWRRKILIYVNYRKLTSFSFSDSSRGSIFGFCILSDSWEWIYELKKNQSFSLTFWSQKMYKKYILAFVHTLSSLSIISLPFWQSGSVRSLPVFLSLGQALVVSSYLLCFFVVTHY